RRHRAPQRPLRAPPRRTWGLEWTGSWRQQAAGVFRLTTPGPPGPARRGYNPAALVGEAAGPTPALPKAQTPVIAQARYHRTRQTLWRDRPAQPEPAPKGHEAREPRTLPNSQAEGQRGTRSGSPAPWSRASRNFHRSFRLHRPGRHPAALDPPVPTPCPSPACANSNTTTPSSNATSAPTTP